MIKYRRAIIRVASEVLTGGCPPWPHATHIVNARMSDRLGEVEFLIEHHSLPWVEEGQIIPYATMLCYQNEPEKNRFVLDDEREKQPQDPAELKLLSYTVKEDGTIVCASEKNKETLLALWKEMVTGTAEERSDGGYLVPTEEAAHQYREYFLERGEEPRIDVIDPEGDGEKRARYSQELWKTIKGACK